MNFVRASCEKPLQMFSVFFGSRGQIHRAFEIAPVLFRLRHIFALLLAGFAGRLWPKRGHDWDEEEGQ